MEKLGEKLHMGGHKKEDPALHTTPAATGPGYGGSALNDPHAPAGTVPPATGAPHKEGMMEKMKNKVKGGQNKTQAKAHGEDSSSSSESDGEGGRRKKKGVL